MEVTCDPPANRVADIFENGFMNRTLEEQIQACETYALRPLFVETFRQHQPVLEAGCGSGQWMHYFKRHGIESVGIDWSPVLRERSLAFDPMVRFDNGDMRELPYADGAFGGVVAMGSPEHVPEGPGKVFREFHRVLKPGGVAIVTVPHFFFLRSLGKRFLQEPARRLKRNPVLRRLAGKSPANGLNPRRHRSVVNDRYRPDVFLDVDFEGYFYQYQFTKKQIAEELASAGFDVERCHAFGGAGGLIFSFGRLAGYYERRTHEARLTLPARLIRRWLTDDGVGHMICCVVRKPSA
jgi:SAM-dependent methyltransferase